MASKAKKFSDAAKGRPELRIRGQLVARVETDGSVFIKTPSLPEADAQALAAWIGDIYDPAGGGN